MGCLGAVVGLAVVAALAGFGTSELIAAKEHGEAPLLALTFLAIPLLVVGILVARLLNRVFLRNRGSTLVQTVAALATIALIGSAMVVVVDANVVNRRPSTELTTALASACSRHAVPGAGRVAAAGNHLVVLDASGHETTWTGFPPLDWRPLALADTELVACVGPETTEVVEVCNYVGGSDITRYSATRVIVVAEAATGREVAQFSVTAEPARCQATERKDVTEHRASVDWDTVQVHLASLVERGVFEDPDADGTTDGENGENGLEPTGPPEPTQRATPRPTPRPTAKPTPATALTTMELRKAIAAKLVTASGTGEGLQTLDLTLTSKTTEDLEITINLGTMLDPGVKGTQTMVVIAPASVTLAAREKLTIELDVACAEMHDDQPGSDDHFTVRSTQASSSVMKLLRSDRFPAESFRIQQFAIWTLIANPTADGYVALGSTFGLSGSGPSDDELETIASLLRSAGIDTSKYRAVR